MLRAVPKPLFLLLTVCAVAACGGEELVEPEPERPPDLTGNYTLQSLTAEVLTAGATLTPPAVTGTFMAQQTAVTGLEASGTAVFSLVLPIDDQGTTLPIDDQGTYVNRLDGTWEQAGQLLQGIGTYTFQGDLLTVVVTEPALNISTTVWRKN